MLSMVLIRPGSTDYDSQQRIQGSLDIPINEHGVDEAMDAARMLADKGVEVIHSPVSQPSMQTAEIIARVLKIKWKKIEHLENLHQGLWEGMLVEDVRHKQPKVYRQWQEQPEIVCPPEGEMLSEADERVRTALVKLMKRHKEGVIGLVLPEPLLSLARRFVVHRELGDLWKPTNGNQRVEWLHVDVDEVLAAGV
jgi:probable phosphoglycerate mutase